MAITPYLYYRDVDRALVFLSNAFGFRTVGDRQRDASGKTTHAAMKLGAGLIMMGRPATPYRNPRALGQATQSLYVNVRNADRIFNRARRAGAALLEVPVDTEYGHRRCGVKDPEGHQWYFAHVLRRRRAAKPVSRSPRKRMK